ncbi:transcriptional regulator [Paenibacillus selenitireducens]|uniref:Transcriptional regulator n=1 Tax=Paenibacillus selenitireducens TaxID=1324314 RepID=A0A1T2XEX9_9BACL|nr:LCP family protein [Paenibacillus selenitireducens]OPA78439.1 transcriptional regulator [Paenibacillus selenitireducens]
MNPASGLPPRERSGRTSIAQKSNKPQNTQNTQNTKKTQKTKPKKAKSPWRTFFKTIGILLIVGIISACVAAGYLVYKADKGLDAISTVSPDEKPLPPELSAKVKPVSMLLLGVDTREDSGGLNTDVFMVATMNPVTKTATVVSIPRDTKVELKGYKSRKINAYYAAFRSQDKDKANDDMKEFVGKYLDIPIDYISMINFKGFADVVDALGGVDVNVDMDMRYVDTADGTNINLKKGFQTLNGEDALNFVRYRKSNTKNPTKGSSDFERNRRQSEVLHEMMRKMQTFDGVTKVPAIIDSVGKNLKMDVQKDQIKDLITTYFTMNKDNVTFIPIEGNWKSPYVYLDDAKFEEAKQALKQELTEK